MIAITPSGGVLGLLGEVLTSASDPYSFTTVGGVLNAPTVLPENEDADVVIESNIVLTFDKEIDGNTLATGIEISYEVLS